MTVFREMGPKLHPLVYVGYSTVFLASLFGNSVIIHIIRTDNSMKTTINYLIINQACADLLISLAEITVVFITVPLAVCGLEKFWVFQDFYSDLIHFAPLFSLDPRSHRC